MNRKSIFLSIVLIIVFVGIGVAGYMLWPAINGAITKNKYYSSEQVQEAYDKGYSDGINNETELNAQIEFYKNSTDEYYSQIVEYQKQIEEMKSNNKSLQNSVDSLTALKAENEKSIQNLQSINAEQQETIKSLNSNISSLTDQVSSLEEQKKNNLARIDELNVRIAELTIQISNLESSGEDKDTQINLLKSQKTELEGKVANLNATIVNLNGQIETLNSQVNNLRFNVQQLESTNALNLQTINSLNAQILTLNTQISELNSQIQNNGSVVSSLNKKIAELEKSIEYYESYIKSLQSGEKVVVTFEFDGSVINVQVVSKGSKVSIVDPQSTDYVIFNYWTVGGDKITLSDYTINDSVTIVANVTYKFDVKFMVDDQQSEKQIVEKDHFATSPTTTPFKPGYEFDGWTINGVDIVEIASYKITGNTTFFAKFTKLHNVVFLYESETKSTQIVRNGEYAQNVSVESTDYKVFNGWIVNGIKVQVDSYKITADTTFIADITYKYDVKFKVDESDHNSQIVESGHFAVLPSNPSKPGYEFDGWTINGTDLVDVSNYKITGPITFVAKFTKLHTVIFKFEEQTLSTQTIRHGEYAQNVSVESTTYKVFNGWKVVDSIVSIDSYAINEDTTFIADITYKYDVKFMVDGSLHNSQIVEKDKFAVVPSTPIKSGYNFDGWTINGNDIVNVSSYKITATTTFFAKFTVLGGAFDYDTGSCIMSWSDLLSNDILTVSDSGLLSTGSNYKDFSGSSLIIPEGVVEMAGVYANTGVAPYITFSTIFAKLKSITFPNSLTLISSSLYNYSNSQLLEINIPSIEWWLNLTIKNNDLYAQLNYCKHSNLFIDGEIVTNVSIPSGVAEIRPYCFAELDALTSVVLPSTISNIGSNAFYFCKNLTNINFPDSLVEIGASAFCWSGLFDLSLNSGLVKVGSRAFSYMYNIDNVVLPGSLTDIGDELFKSSSLKSVVFGSGITKVVSNMFEKCSSLTNVVLSDTIVSIYQHAFDSCVALKHIFLPSSVTSIKAGSSSYSYSPFLHCSSDLVIYCGASAKQTGWFTYWNYYDNGKILSVKYGYSYSQYLSEVGLA